MLKRAQHVILDDEKKIITSLRPAILVFSFFPPK